MAGPLERSFSFNYHDEQSLQPRGAEDQHSQSYQNDAPQISPIETRSLPFPSSYNANPPPPERRNVPVGMHPGSAYAQMQSQRQYGITPTSAVPANPLISQNPSQSVPRTISIPRRPVSQSPPPDHIVGVADATNNVQQPRRQSFTTPGMDDLGEAAVGGGIAGIAMGVANTNERESGLQALRGIDNWGRSENGTTGPANIPSEREFDPENSSLPYGYNGPEAVTRRPVQPQTSYSSTEPIAPAAYAPGTAAIAGENTSERSLTLNERPPPSRSGYPYTDDPYNRYSSSNLNLTPTMGAIDPTEIADDGDDGITRPPQTVKRKSLLPFGSRTASRDGISLAAGAGAGAAAGAGAFAALGARDPSGNYGPVPSGGDGPGDSSDHVEKSEWLNRQNHGNKRLKWIVGTILAIVVVGAIVGGVIGGVLSRKHSSNNSSSNPSNPSTPQSVANDNKNDLSKDSPEIQALMNNKNLHKVFPGMDYNPLNTQYPACLTSPPSQNNVTRDMAVLSQLTNAVRLYGTDCNQTQMVLHAIDRLQLTDMKVWLGVWLDNNDTTNARQMAEMWKILDTNGTAPFKGLIIGNEVLYRKDLTLTQLATVLKDVKTNLTAKNMDLPVATSDLGDNWTADLVADVDIVMSNVHPFFAGVTAELAAGWTWDFWQTHDVVLTGSNSSVKQVISEVGWPSGGGNDCGGATCTSTTQGSIAGVDEMNTFMSDFICQSLDNGTDYFW